MVTCLRLTSKSISPSFVERLPSRSVFTPPPGLESFRRHRTCGALSEGPKLPFRGAAVHGRAWSRPNEGTTLLSVCVRFGLVVRGVLFGQRLKRGIELHKGIVHSAVGVVAL